MTATIVCLAFLSGPSPIAASPAVLDSAFAKTYFASFRVGVVETRISSTKIKTSSAYDLYLDQKARQFAVEYRKSPDNPSKKIWFQRAGMDIWTSDSIGGRIRKIGNHKKTEPMNGSSPSYWLFPPFVMAYSNYTLVTDSLISPEIRQLRCETEAPNPYALVEFTLEAGSFRPQSIKLYNYNGSLSKSLAFTFSEGPDSPATLAKVTLIDRKDGSWVVQKFKNPAPLDSIPKSFFSAFNP